MAFYKEDIVDINLNSGNIFRSFLNHSIGYKDDDADRFGIRAFRDGEPVDLSGASCQAVFMAPNGDNIALTSYGTVSGNVAYVTLPQACYNYEGQFCLAIKLVGGGVTGTVRIVDGMVVNTGASGTVTPTASVPTYQEILAVYADMQEDIADYESVVANQNDQINSLKSAIDAIKEAEADYNGSLTIGEITAGYKIDTSGGVATSSPWSRSSFINIDNAKSLLFTCPESSNSASVSSTAAIAFYSNNSADSFISPCVPIRLGKNNNYSLCSVDVPNNAKFIRVTMIKDLESSYFIVPVQTVKDISAETLSIFAKSEEAMNTKLDNGEITEGYVITVTGSVAENTNWARTSFISITDASKLLVTLPNWNNYTETGTYAAIAFYSAEDASTFISYVPIKQSNKQGLTWDCVNIPATAKYVRVSIIKSLVSNYKIIPVYNYSDARSIYENIIDPSALHSRNLIGMEPGVFYPVDIAANEKFVFSTSDGSQMSVSSTVLIRFLDENKVVLGTIMMNSGYNYFKRTNTYSKTIKYMQWRDESSVAMMVEKGWDIHPYVPYYTEVDKKFYKYNKPLVNLTDVDPQEETKTIIINIEPELQYIVGSDKLFGHDISVYTGYNDTWTQRKLININTGKESVSEYQHGEYFIPKPDTDTKMKIVSNMADTNSLRLYCIRSADVPYIVNSIYASSYIPDAYSCNVFELRECFGEYNGYMYGIEGKNIQKVNIQTREKTTVYTHEYNIACGIIFGNGNIVFVESQDTHNKMYLLSDGTITEKHDFYNSEYSLRLTPNRLFSLHSYGQKAIICEYYGSKTPISGYKAYMTNDYGSTWSALFDLSTLVSNPSQNDAHLHTVVYDEYGDMYWASSGDGRAVNMIWYSMDGTTWYPIQSPYISGKPTEIVPMRDCVMFISDMRTVNIYKWQRREIIAGESLWLDTIKVFVPFWEGACPIGAHAYYDPQENLTYFGYYTDASINEGYDGDIFKYSDLFVTDGNRVKKIYNGNAVRAVLGVYGDNNRVFISRLDYTIMVQHN